MERVTDNRPVIAQFRERLRDLVARDGEKAAAKAVGVSRATLGRVLGGLPVTPAVAFMVETKLREHATGAAS